MKVAVVKTGPGVTWPDRDGVEELRLPSASAAARRDRRAGRRAARSRCRTAPSRSSRNTKKSGQADAPSGAAAAAGAGQRAAGRRRTGDRAPGPARVAGPRPATPRAEQEHASSFTPSSAPRPRRRRRRRRARRVAAARRQAPQRLRHDGDDHRLHAVEQPARLGQRPEAHVGPARAPPVMQHGRQDEADAGDDQARPSRRGASRCGSPSPSSSARGSGSWRRADRGTRSRVSHSRRRTTSSSIIAMCAAGPPNAVAPSAGTAPPARRARSGRPASCVLLRPHPVGSRRARVDDWAPQ